MPLVVQKFGGSSVSDAASIKRVAQRVVETKEAGSDVVVVVSAMGDTTDDLLELAGSITRRPAARELDILLTAGERMSMSLLAMAITELGVPARSYTGQQAGVHTDTVHGRASIVGVVPKRIAETTSGGSVAIVAGFQGVSEAQDVTTLGRGGSDTTAVALAAALGAEVCEIFTDVDGLFTADPRIVPTARPIKTITSEETLEMAAHGAKILHLRAVEYARRYHVPIHVRSSFSDKAGTWISDPDHAKEDTAMEEPIISGVAHDSSQGKITVKGVPDVPGAAARIFAVVATAGANIDMIVQNVSSQATGLTDISFTLAEADGEATLAGLRDAAADLGYDDLRYDDQIGKLSLVGAGMRTHPGVSAKLFGALFDAGINIEMISTSEIRISVVTRTEDLEEAVRAVHSAFELDSGDTKAVIYGGSGR